jgi:hypothetical protein
MVQISYQPAGRRHHRAAELSKTVQGRDIVDAAQTLLAAVAGKLMRLAQDGFKRRIGPAVRRHQLARPQPRQSRAHPVGCAFFQFHPARRNVAGGNADHPANLAHGGQHIGAARLQQRFLGQRARRHETHNVALDQSLGAALLLGLLRRFHLLGDGHAASRLDEARKVSLRRMDRHAAHGDRRARMLAPCGQRDVEHLGGGLCIVEEEFEKIAHPVEQQAIGGLRLEGEILDHHRGCPGSFGVTHSATVSALFATGKRRKRRFPLSVVICFG